MIQIAERFNDATQDDIDKSIKEKDVCCLCLSAMNKLGKVKKLTCNHLLHTTCLCDIIQKAKQMARSRTITIQNAIQMARCPICRVSDI